MKFANFLLMFFFSIQSYAATNDIVQDLSKKIDWSTSYFCEDAYSEKGVSLWDKTRVENISKKFDPELKHPVVKKLLELSDKKKEIVKSRRDIKTELVGLFENLQKAILEPNGWKSCPPELFRECNVIAMSKLSNDNRGEMLDGKQAPLNYRQTDESRWELLQSVYPSIKFPSDVKRVGMFSVGEFHQKMKLEEINQTELKKIEKISAGLDAESKLAVQAFCKALHKKHYPEKYKDSIEESGEGGAVTSAK